MIVCICHRRLFQTLKNVLYNGLCLTDLERLWVKYLEGCACGCRYQCAHTCTRTCPCCLAVELSIISSACYIRSIAIYLLFLCNSAESVCGSHLVLLIFLFHLAAYSSPTALPVSHLYFVLCRVMLPVLLSKWDWSRIVI